MQSEELKQKIAAITKRMPFIKALFLADIEDGVEIFEQVSDDFEIVQDEESKVKEKISGLRHTMIEMLRHILDQVSKLNLGKNQEVSVMYDKFYIQQKRIGDNIVLIVFCDTDTVDLGMLQYLGKEITKNFTDIDKILNEINKNI